MNGINGTTVGLAAKEGPTIVAITASTKVFQVNPAQLTDVTTGSCVDVQLAAAAPGAPPAPAKGVTVSPPSSNGKCSQATSEKGVRGKVTAVNGETVSVANSDTASTSVLVDPKTKFLTRIPTTALIITPGACLSATGTLVPNGALEAATATVGPPPKELCPGS